MVLEVDFGSAEAVDDFCDVAVVLREKDWKNLQVLNSLQWQWKWVLSVSNNYLSEKARCRT